MAGKIGIFHGQYSISLKLILYTNYTMNLRVVFNLLLVFSFAVVQGKSQRQGFDKSVFYKVMASGNADDIDAQINIVRMYLWYLKKKPMKERF